MRMNLSPNLFSSAPFILPLSILTYMCARILLSIFLLLVLPSITLADESDKQMELEVSVCGIKEPFLFWLWSHMAGNADASRLAGLHGVEDLSFTSRDGRVLRGYRLRSRIDKPKGYLLVLQGNAILADQLIGEFVRYANSGYDVYMYDYRGYGRSQGKRRLKAIVSDIQEILATLNTKLYERHLVYAFSFGGIVLLDGFDGSLELDRIVIDSSPSRLSDYGCPKTYDPVTHLPGDASHFMFISGRRDTVVTPAMSKELLSLAKQRKASVINDVDFAHPFMDPDPSLHRQRMVIIEQFLLQQETK